MKGIVLAGGTGSRLYPLTEVTNKHLLPVYNKPMIFHPIETLIQGGIKEILIVTGGESIGDIMRLLRSGKRFGVDITYKIQDEAGGIAQALNLAEKFSNGGPISVILGDNIFEDNINLISFTKGAKIFLKPVEDPHRFGVAEVTGNKVTNIVEKPKEPKTNLAVTGLYVYDSDVFNIIKTLKPSARGELEITDVNNEYIKRNKMTFEILNGSWSDAGTFQSLHRAAQLTKEKEEKKVK